MNLARKPHHSPHCLNCGERLKGQFCYKCGQDNLDHQESVWHLVKHFFEDITHYDGKLWKTVHPLLTQPGVLTQQFLAGKRVSYLNPVRLFIFLNFIFFFLVLSLPSNRTEADIHGPNTLAENKPLRDSVLREIRGADSVVTEEVKIGKVMSLHSSLSYNTVTEYDSAQQALPYDKRAGKVSRLLSEKWISFLQVVKKDPEQAEERATEIFLHNSAKLTFLFIIICSLMLYVLYWRKHMYMVNHAMFSIHLACTFLLISVAMPFAGYLPFGGYLLLLLFLYGNYYFYRALRVVYGQPRGKTVLKFIVINIFLLVGMSFGLLMNALLTMMSLKD